MSLINDALKKAEQLRSDDAAPPPMLARQSQSVSAGPRTDRRPVFVLAAGGVVAAALFLGAAAALVMALKSGTSEPVPPTPRQAAAVQSTEVSPPDATPSAVTVTEVIPVFEPISEPAPGVAVIPVEEIPAVRTPESIRLPQPAPAAVIAFKTPLQEDPQPVVEQPTAPEQHRPIQQPQPVNTPPQPPLASVASLSGRPEYLRPIAISSRVASVRDQSTPVPAAAQDPGGAAPIKYTPAAPEPNPAIIAYVDRLEIQGIKLAGAGSKVLFNNRVFRINSMVNYELNIRVSSIKKSEIVFTDHVGITYTKYF